MEIRGKRRCLDCEATWNYFETGGVSCPECGSIRSEATSGEEKDTSGPGLDTSDLIGKFGSDFREALGEAADRCRSYVSRQGFIEAGDLRPPEARYVMAAEIVEIEGLPGLEFGDGERRYVVDLVRGLRTGDPPDERPESLDAAHNLALARTAEKYIRDLRRYARSEDVDMPRVVEEAREAVKRTQATEGEEDDAVDALRVLRDAYMEVASHDG